MFGRFDEIENPLYVNLLVAGRLNHIATLLVVRLTYFGTDGHVKLNACLGLRLYQRITRQSETKCIKIGGVRD